MLKCDFVHANEDTAIKFILDFYFQVTEEKVVPRSTYEEIIRDRLNRGEGYSQHRADGKQWVGIGVRRENDVYKTRIAHLDYDPAVSGGNHFIVVDNLAKDLEMWTQKK